MNKASALWHLSAERSAIAPTELHYNISGYVEIESLYSLVSLGTEKLVSQGQVPTELFKSMTVPYMEGSFMFPLKYGYSLIGRVVKGNKSLIDKTVHILHPHQDRCCVAAKDIFVIENDVPAKRAVLASNMETALNAVWDSGISAGDKILVVGFGVVGSLVARLVSLMPATEVLICDINPAKRKIATDLGFSACAPDQLPDDFDVAFNTSASEGGLQLCIDKVGFEGRIVELSWYGRSAVNVHLGASFHNQRKSIISTQVSSLPNNRLARWDFRRRKEAVFRLLQNPIFDSHITNHIAFDKLPELFDKLRKNTLSGLTWVVEYNKK